MQLPVIRGLIDRRLLINYRADPAVVQQLLPSGMQPQLVAGHAIVGLCLIRLRQIRPLGLPSWLGIGSENAAHRIAVQWVEHDRRKTGVYIFRRDTNSRINALAGGCIFPGVHHHSEFRIHETAERLEVSFASADRATIARVVARPAQRWPGNSVFESLAEASNFFERAPLGYSPSTVPGELQGLELRCHTWQAEPLALDDVQSSFFDDPQRFPAGTLHLDSGLMMRGIEHEWHERPALHGAMALKPGYTARGSSSPTQAAITS